MPNTKEIKNHIHSVQDTQKITNAMYLISSTKLRKAKAELDKTRPYFRALQAEIKRVFRVSQNVHSRYFYPPDGEPTLHGTNACLVITADKGLADAYNQNIIRQTETLLAQHPDTKLFVVGEYGRQYFSQHRIPVEKSFLYTAQNPTMQRAREISYLLLELFERGEVEKIYVLYTDMQNGLTGEATLTRLLPFHRAQFYSDGGEQTAADGFEFTPSVQAVLDSMIPSYVSGFIYSALVDSFCCEQNARMTAMDSANRNAEKLLGQLTAQYNRVRQTAITQEITEVSAGAKALRLKRKRVKQQQDRKREEKLS